MPCSTRSTSTPARSLRGRSTGARSNRTQAGVSPSLTERRSSSRIRGRTLLRSPIKKRPSGAVRSKNIHIGSPNTPPSPRHGSGPGFFSNGGSMPRTLGAQQPSDDIWSSPVRGDEMHSRFFAMPLSPTARRLLRSRVAIRGTSSSSPGKSSALRHPAEEPEAENDVDDDDDDDDGAAVFLEVLDKEFEEVKRWFEEEESKPWPPTSHAAEASEAALIPQTRTVDSTMRVPTSLEEAAQFVSIKGQLRQYLSGLSTAAQATAKVLGNGEVVVEICADDPSLIDVGSPLLRGLGMRVVLQIGHPSVHAFDEDKPKHVTVGALLPGSSIGAADSIGTFGCYLRSHNGALFGLTCGHTFRPGMQSEKLRKQDFYSVAPLDVTLGKWTPRDHWSAAFGQIARFKDQAAQKKRAGDRDGWCAARRSIDEEERKKNFWIGQEKLFRDIKALAGKERLKKLLAGQLQTGYFALKDERHDDWGLLSVTDVPEEPNLMIHHGATIGVLQMSKPFTPGMRVAKLGRTTGLTYGVISAAPGVLRWHNGIDPQVTWGDGNTTEEVIIAGENKTVFSVEGDSGSVVYDPVDFAVVGIIHGGLKPYNTLTYMLPIGQVLESIKTEVGEDVEIA